jgi:hypothetical protein
MLMNVIRRHWRRLLVGFGGSLLAGAAVKRKRTHAHRYDEAVQDAGPIVEDISLVERLRRKVKPTAPPVKRNSGGGGGGRGAAPVAAEPTAPRQSSEREPVKRTDVSKKVAELREAAAAEKRVAEAERGHKPNDRSDDHGLSPRFGRRY